MPLILLLCGLCFPLCTESQTREYHFVNQNLNWREAQGHCRQHYHDLASVWGTQDISRLPRPPDYSGYIWIGLLNNATDTSRWLWLKGSSVLLEKWSDPHALAYIHPHSMQCGMMNNSGWYSRPCSALYKAVCFSGVNPKVFYLSTYSVDWTFASYHCSLNQTNLALIETETEYSQVLQVAGSSEVWISLYKYSWRWSENSYVTFFNWSSTSENTLPPSAYCAAEGNDRAWHVRPCLDEEHPFYCQGNFIDLNGPQTLKEEVKKSSDIVKIQLSSGLDLFDPTVYKLVLEQISERFKEVRRSDVKIKWMTPPKKQEKKEENMNVCHLYV